MDSARRGNGFVAAYLSRVTHSRRPARPPRWRSCATRRPSAAAWARPSVRSWAPWPDCPSAEGHEPASLDRSERIGVDRACPRTRSPSPSNRTGKTYEVPVAGRGVRAMDLRQIKVDAETSAYHLRPGVHQHRLVPLGHHLHRRRQGHPRLPGYPFEQLAESSSYLEVAYLDQRRAAQHDPARELRPRGHRSTATCTRTSRTSSTPSATTPTPWACWSARSLPSRRTTRRARRRRTATTAGWRWSGSSPRCRRWRRSRTATRSASPRLPAQRPLDSPGTCCR